MISNKHFKALELDKVLEMLSECATVTDSKEMALEIQPSTSLYEVQSLVSQTNAAYVLLARYGSPSFGTIKNCNSAFARANAGGVLNLRELLDAAEVLRVIRSVYEWRFNKESCESCLDVYFSSLVPNRSLEEDITRSIVSEEEVSDLASPALADIRRKIRNKSQGIREKLEQLIRSSYYQKYLRENIITQRNGRFVVPVKAECRGSVPGLVHDTSGSGSTVFVEPMAVVEANNEIRVLQGKEQEEIERILTALSAAVGDFGDTLKHNYESLCELNLIFAKAQLAYKMKASLPILNTTGIVELKKARHPLLAQDKVVPTDINLGIDFDTLVITGPNTGGKTVSIKTVGLLTLMACCGLMIPASDNSRICVFEKIFADIGDEQSIEQSLSTFSSHMVNIVDILNKSDDKSLVLIDELGAGTDPVEGAALAIAILERLHINGAKIAATTHYAELKAYALQTDRVQNASCEFNVETLRPTYRLLIGVPGRSNAFAISEKLGMDSLLIERANEFVSGESIRFEDVVDSLEESRLALEKERDELRAEKLSCDKKLEEAEKKLAEAQSVRDKEYERAKGEAMKITENARRQANALIMEADTLRKEMKNASDVAEMAKKAKQAMKKQLGELDDTINPVSASIYENDEYKLPREPVAGDSVFLIDLGREALVKTPRDKKNNIEVIAGSMRMRVNISRIRLIEKQKSKPKQNTSFSRPGSFESKLNTSASNRLDLRGKAVDEALPELDSFISQMIMAGLNEFTVIHGKGTGVLRSACQKYLKQNKFVKSFRLGVYGEGEDGVTIVTLK